MASCRKYQLWSEAGNQIDAAERNADLRLQAVAAAMEPPAFFQFDVCILIDAED